MIRITRDIVIDDDEVTFEFVRSPGPGGQNVNTVSTAAQLRFDVAANGSLSDEVKQRLRTLAGRRLTAAGVLIAEEAVAVVTDFSIRSFTIDKKEILATNGNIHNERVSLMELKDTR